MAIAEYIIDLLLLTNAESGTWGEFLGYAAGGVPDNTEADYYIEGAGCTSQSFGNKSGAVFSIAFDSGVDQIMGIGDCAFIWQVVQAGNAIETFDNGGYRVGIGSTLNDFDMWYSGGSDFARNPYGGWQNVAVDPSATPNATTGTPTGTQWFGSLVNTGTTVISKGNPHGVDVLRIGRGEFMFWGGDLANGYGDFAVCASINDTQENRYGLFQEAGVVYLWKGLLSFGKDASACDFRDENRGITIDNTPLTYTDFNRVNFNNTASNISWINVNFTAADPSQLSRGSFNVIDDCSIFWDTCIFTDVSTFQLASKTEVIDSTFRRAGSIDQSTAILDGCFFEECVDPITIYSNDLDNIKNCEFVSSGSNHAFYLGPESSGATFSFVGNTFNNYATVDGATGNEVIWNNSGGLVIINLTSGDSPTYRDTGDSSTQVLSSVTLTLTVSGEDQQPINGALAYIDDPANTAPFIMNTTTNASGIATTGWGGGPVAGAYWRVRLYGYKPFLAISDITATNKEIPVTLVKDPQQY